MFLLEAPGDDLFLLWQLHALACGPFLLSKARSAGVLLKLPPLWFSLLASSSTYKDLCDYTGPSRIMSSQDQLISKLNPICNFTSSLPCNLICSQVPGTRARTSLGGWEDSVLLTTVRPSFSQLAQSILLATVFGVYKHRA